MDRAPQEEGILRLCQEEGVGFIAFSPLAQGLLTQRYLHSGIPADSRMAQARFLKPSALTPELLSQLRDWQAEAAAEGLSLAQWALRWVARQEGVVSVLAGASRVEQLRDNLAAFDKPLC